MEVSSEVGKWDCYNDAFKRVDGEGWGGAEKWVEAGERWDERHSEWGTLKLGGGEEVTERVRERWRLCPGFLGRLTSDRRGEFLNCNREEVGLGRKWEQMSTRWHWARQHLWCSYSSCCCTQVPVAAKLLREVLSEFTQHSRRILWTGFCQRSQGSVLGLSDAGSLPSLLSLQLPVGFLFSMAVLFHPQFSKCVYYIFW